MGTDNPDAFATDGEGPVRPVRVEPFRLSPHTVTNAEFAAFITATGYRTDAERFGWWYVFAGFLPAELRRASPRPDSTPWWCAVQSAFWAAPEGPGSTWQGRFPVKNTAEDGYRGTAPVDAYPPNGYGLHNMAGNVWEWCADRWSTEHSAVHPRGPEPDTEPEDFRVVRGGSYLCHHSYCNRYRVAARTSNTADSSSGNTGFRVAQDA